MDSEGPIAPRKLHVRVGLAFVQTLRLLLYALLVATAALTFFAGDPAISRHLPTWIAQASPVLFGAFVIVFAVYRLKLMSARRYPALFGFFQIGLAALVWVLLLPGQRQKIDSVDRDDVQTLLASPDSRVRAVAAEAAGHRAGAQRYARALVDLTDDNDPVVRTSARQALSLIAGSDVAAGAADPEASKLWKAEATRRGWMR